MFSFGLLLPANFMITELDEDMVENDLAIDRLTKIDLTRRLQMIASNSLTVLDRERMVKVKEGREGSVGLKEN